MSRGNDDTLDWMGGQYDVAVRMVKLEDDTSVAVPTPASGTTYRSRTPGRIYLVVPHCVEWIFVVKNLSGQVEKNLVDVGATSR